MTEVSTYLGGARVRILFVVLLMAIVAEFTFAEEGFEYDTKGNRDPFVPLVSKGGAYVSDAYGISGINDIRLEGIVWDSAQGSIAIINGEIVKEGQEIGSAKVLRIDKDAVVFEVNREEIRIELRSD